MKPVLKVEWCLLELSQECVTACDEGVNNSIQGQRSAEGQASKQWNNYDITISSRVPPKIHRLKKAQSTKGERSTGLVKYVLEEGSHVFHVCFCHRLTYMNVTVNLCVTCVNLTVPQGAQMKHFFMSMSMRVFLDEIGIWRGGLNKVASPVWVGTIQTLEGLNTTKGVERRNLPLLLLPVCLLKLRHGSSLAIEQGFMSSCPYSHLFQLRLSYTTGFPGYPVSQ